MGRRIENSLDERIRRLGREVAADPYDVEAVRRLLSALEQQGRESSPAQVVRQDEEAVREAEALLRARYYRHVTAVARAIVRELCSARNSSSLQAELMDRIEEYVGGDPWTMTGPRAFDVIRYSDNESAAFEAGVGEVREGDFPWRLAYFAMRADVVEAIEAMGVDVNDPLPVAPCEACGEPPLGELTSEHEDDCELEGRLACAVHHTCAPNENEESA